MPCFKGESSIYSESAWTQHQQKLTVEQTLWITHKPVKIPSVSSECLPLNYWHLWREKESLEQYSSSSPVMADGEASCFGDGVGLHKCEAAMFPSSSRCFHSRLLAWWPRSRYLCTVCSVYIAQPPQNAPWLATPIHNIVWGPSHLPLILYSNPVRNLLSIQSRAAAWHLPGPLGGRHTPGASCTEGPTKWLNG